MASESEGTFRGGAGVGTAAGSAAIGGTDAETAGGGVSMTGGDGCAIRFVAEISGGAAVPVSTRAGAGAVPADGIVASVLAGDGSLRASTAARSPRASCLGASSPASTDGGGGSSTAVADSETGVATAGAGALPCSIVLPAPHAKNTATPASAATPAPPATIDDRDGRFAAPREDRRALLAAALLSAAPTGATPSGEVFASSSAGAIPARRTARSRRISSRSS